MPMCSYLFKRASRQAELINNLNYDYVIKCIENV